MMNISKAWLIPLLASVAMPAFAAEADSAADNSDNSILVIGQRERSTAGTKTDTPLIETPQAITVVPAELYLSQGAISISDTLRYVAGVTANPYGPDTRIDGGFVRGLDPLQYRDGMRDTYSYYADTRADPYNFSRVELVRGPASTLFGAGALGGLLNKVSKSPEFTNGGQVALRYGSFDRKELMADVNGVANDGLAGRLVVLVRDAGTQVDHVPDDRVMIAPSLRWQPSSDTDVRLLGLYQEDDGGSTAQFLPYVGTLLPNPNGKLPNNTFIGKPGWDRYDGRLLQGTGIVDHRFSPNVKISLKARYIDSDLDYFTHYPNSYGNPGNPYLDPDQRIIGLIAAGSVARLNIFSTDNNVQFDFDTGSAIKHVVLAGVDYSWNRVRKNSHYAFELIDIYNIDYNALSNYGGGLPSPSDPGYLYPFPEDSSQKALGFYVQDQIRMWEKVSLVVGARRDHVRIYSPGVAAETFDSTTFRAGLIAEVLPGISPFISYTESFDPILGTASNGRPFKPKSGRQYEGGVKFHPDSRTLLTVAAYHIRESGSPVDDPTTANPSDRRQAGKLVSKGYEFEGSRTLPGNFELLVNYSYTNTYTVEPIIGRLAKDNVPKRNASIWATKTVAVAQDARLKFGGGVRYTSPNDSGTIHTPSYTLVDAIAELSWTDWSFSVTATNLFDKQHYAACLSRGDCFIGADRNIMATVTRRF